MEENKLNSLLAEAYQEWRMNECHPDVDKMLEWQRRNAFLEMVGEVLEVKVKEGRLQF